MDMHIPSPDTPVLTQADIDQRVFDLYDEYCHGRMDRRSFLAAASLVLVFKPSSDPHQQAKCQPVHGLPRLICRISHLLFLVALRHHMIILILDTSLR